MEALHGLVVMGGELRVKTDDLPYFQWMEKVFARAKGWERLDWPTDPDYPVTDFERRFLEKGLPVYRAQLRKVSWPMKPDATKPSASNVSETAPH